jgi:L-fucose isomerase-like protein
MTVVLQPVHVIGQAWHVFPQENGQLLVATDPTVVAANIRTMLAPLEKRLADHAEFREPILLLEPADRERVIAAATGVDGVLVSMSGGVNPELWDLPCPVVAYSGECTPMMGLYVLPHSERGKHSNLTYCLDAEEVLDCIRSIRLRKVKDRLRGSRMIILGEYNCFERLPDPETVRRTLGIEHLHVSSAEFVKQVDAVDEARARAVARQWTDGAQEVGEPSADEVYNGARMHVALEDLMRREHAQAVSVGCLEVMYTQQRAPFCFVLATLRDVGLPAGCESDAGATLTMLLLEYLADRPAYMGNLVLADPVQNLVSVSHGCSPTRMLGHDQPAKPYRLVHSHSAPPFSRDLTGGSGVTSYVDYGDRGQVVTLARLSHELDALFVARGEIVECRDTICDRTTLTMRVADARDYVHKTMGNHQVLIYGDFVDDLGGLCDVLGLACVRA